MSLSVKKCPLGTLSVPQWRTLPTFPAYFGAVDRERAARRTRAAVALAGYERVEDLATNLDGSGVGLKRLRQIYQQRGTEPRRVELREIAEACNLPFAFFEVDFATLGQPDAATEERLTALEKKLEERVGGLQTALEALTADGRAPSRESGSKKQQSRRRKNPPPS